MTKRLAMTPAVGLFAGLSVVSYGAVSMMITGVQGTRQASTNPCTAAAPNNPAPMATAARMQPKTRTVGHVSGRAQHPASMLVLLAHAVPLASASSTPALPSTQPSPSASAPALPQPSPNSSAGPSSSLPEPAPAKSTGSNGLTPGGTLKSPGASPTPTRTSSPSPSSTATSTPTTSPPTTPAPKGTLCLEVQTLNNVSSVDPHDTVRYAIWVWLSSGTNGTA